MAEPAIFSSTPLPRFHGVIPNEDDMEYAVWLHYIFPEVPIVDALLESIELRTFLMPRGLTEN